MNTLRRLSLLSLTLIASSSFAGTSNAVPEPGTWALIALAGAIGVVVARNKRK